MRAHHIVFDQTGGPEVLRWRTTTLAEPAAGEVLIRHEAVGLNYIDTYFRNGLYPVSVWPAGLGLEAAGVVEAVGAGVVDLAAGDRVAYAGGPLGAYADRRLFPAERLVRLPDSVPYETAAAMMLQGMTAHYLLHRTYRVQAGEWILVHAAAGGTGSLLSQWAHALGAKVIGTVGSSEKAALAHAQGCDETILYREQHFAECVREITKGDGVSVVYDSVGADTFLDSLSCLRPLGMMVSFGASSGPVPPFDVSQLAGMGSLFLTRPTLFTYIAARQDLLDSAQALFTAVQAGHLKITVQQRYALTEVVRAHTDLEARQTKGATILLPPQS